MARKKKHEEHENHERWLVSYADFITLLFAFFVVMYAVSSVNQGKYRVLSDSLVAAFNEPKKSFEPIQLGEMVRSATNASIEIVSKPTLIKVPIVTLFNREEDEGKMPGAGVASSEESARTIQQIAEEVAQALQKLVDLGLVTITMTDLWVEVEIKDSVLFPSGSAQIHPEAVQVLTRLAAILAGFANPVRIEGFTDNVPITTRFFPSNWELSAARAASVVRLFERQGIASPRLSAVGYGEHRPIAANDSAEGRAKNRRVVMVVLADKEVEYLLDERLRQSVSAEVPGAVSTVTEGGTGAAISPAGATTPAPTEDRPGAGAADAAPPAAVEEEGAAVEAAPVVIAPVAPPATVSKAPTEARDAGGASRNGGTRPLPPNPRPPRALAPPVVPALPERPLELVPPARSPGLGLELPNLTGRPSAG
ncbi:MAG: flagellar motor protein MotD [Gammaproteobacteria bacterium]|nr:flagellar motor protein MotD [Gammaproteobacteria bacterium]